MRTAFAVVDPKSQPITTGPSLSVLPSIGNRTFGRRVIFPGRTGRPCSFVLPLPLPLPLAAATGKLPLLPCVEYRARKSFSSASSFHNPALPSFFFSSCCPSAIHHSSLD